MKLVGFAHGQTLDFFTDNYGNVRMLVGGNFAKGFAHSLAIVSFCPDKIENYTSPKITQKLTKLAYANQKGRYFGRVGRIDASLSPDKKTLCIWYATDKNDSKNPHIDIGKIQIACYDFRQILNKLGNSKSLSFKSDQLKGKYCYASCEQLDKKSFIRPYGSNQGIAVSNQYKVMSKGKKVRKHKVYLSAGAQQDKSPMCLCMMTITRRSSKTLSLNGIYHTRAIINMKKVSKGPNLDVIKWEIEKVCIDGTKLRFVIAPAPISEGGRILKSEQYLYNIPTNKMNSGK